VCAFLRYIVIFYKCIKVPKEWVFFNWSPFKSGAEVNMDLRGKKWRQSGEFCIMRGFISLYASRNIVRVIKSRRMRWTGHVTRMGEKRNAYCTLVGKPEGKRPLGRSRRR
jgi:hypothetical protein